MKKIALFFLTFIFSTNVFASQQTSNEIELNTPVRWYAKALSNAIFKMAYPSNGDADGVEHASAIAREFLQTLDVKDGVVLISPAEFIDKCMSVYQAFDASTKCSNAVMDAVHFHNELVQSFANANALNDRNTKIEWNFRVWNSALGVVLDLDLVPLANIFNDYMKSVNNIASLNDWLAECNRAMQFISSSNTPFHKDAVVRMQSHDFSCQKYIEALEQKYNEFSAAYSTETTIKL